jgi:hypothetical protein
VLEAGRHGYVFVRHLDECTDFRIDEEARLAGCRVAPWLEVPRALDADGRQRRDLFVFCLRSRADLRTFAVGDRVRLTSGGS